MFRILMMVGVIAAAAVVAGIAHAQVAAPLLTPGSANVAASQLGFEADPTYVPVNPAVMTWSRKSSFGLGQTQAKREQTEPVKDTIDFTGTYGGLLWNADSFAVGLETMDMSADTSGVTFTYKQTAGGLSGVFADWVSLGASLANVESDGGTTTDKVNAWSAGGSLKLGNVFYVGVGTGKEAIKHDETGNDWDDDRTVTQYGLALYTGGKGASGSMGAVWHLEYNVVEKDDFTDARGDSVQGFTRSTGTVEVLWNSLLLSYSSISLKAKTGDGTLEGSAIEAGWVSERGLFVTGRVQSFKESIDPLETDISVTAVNVGLQF